MKNYKKNIQSKIFYILFFTILIFSFINVAFAQPVVDPSGPIKINLPQQEPANTKAGDDLSPTTFYEQVNPRLLPTCAVDSKGKTQTGFNGVLTCMVNITKRLQPIAAVLLVLVITISGAYLIFSPLD